MLSALRQTPSARIPTPWQKVWIKQNRRSVLSLPVVPRRFVRGPQLADRLFGFLILLFLLGICLLPAVLLFGGVWWVMNLIDQ